MIVASLFFAAVASGHAAHAAPASANAVPLFDDLGSYHRAISTKNRAAQRYFDQGIRLLYGFNHDEAERAFREAARLDPQCGICYWGVGLTLGPNINLPMDPDRNVKAVEALAKAKAPAARASAVERALIDALAVRYSADPAADRAKLDEAYADAMTGVYRRFPADDDVATLYAEAMMDLRPWKFWNADGTPAPGTEAIVATLETVLKRNPTHPGANHYYIHATEASKNPERGTASAKRLETLVPGAGHLVHMPAHVYMRTGNYAGASDANAKAVAIDEKYIKANNVQGVYPIMYYTHNQQFLAAAAAMEGRSAVAREAAQKTTDLAIPVAKEMPMAEFVVPWAMYFALRFEKWDDVLAMPKPDDALPTAVALWHFGRGVAFAAQNKLDEANGEKTAFHDAAAKIPPRRHDEPQHQQGPSGGRGRFARRQARAGARGQARSVRLMDASGDGRGCAGLRRASRVVLPRAGVPGRRLSSRRQVHHGRAGLPKGLGAQPRERPVAVRPGRGPEGPEEGRRGRRSDGTVQEGVGAGRRDADHRRPVRRSKA
jgi:tetratricopeptide (TPR) repeat protein